jgi:hypothetical protein
MAMPDNTQTLKDMAEDFGGPDAKYKVTQSGNSWILNSIEGEVFLYINNEGDYQVLNADQVRKAYITNAGGTAGIDNLRNKLYKANYMNEAEFKLKDATALNRAIIDAARNVSVEAVTNYTDMATPLTQSFDSWLNKRVAMSGSSGQPDSGINLTTRMDTNQDINEFFMEYLGRNATEAEKTDYYNKVNAEEKKAVRTVKVVGGKQVSTGEQLDATDYYRIRASVLAPVVKGTAIEEVTKGNGKIAQDVAELKAFATDYGIKLDTKQALDRIVGGLKPGGSLTTGKLDAEKTAIREMSKAFYGKLTPLIDQGVKISDIASQFAYYKGQILEMPDSAVSVFDEDIQAALKNEGGDGVMTITDYQKFLRTNPKTKQQWLKTKGAKEEAAGYATEILKSFGLMA